MNRRPLVLGNWKMNGDMVRNEALLAAVLEHSAAVLASDHVDAGIAAPAPYLFQVAVRCKGRGLQWGAQDVSDEHQGAFTGETSVDMLRDFDAHFALVGHSERRARHGEADSQVAKKVACLLEAGLTPVVCVGESLSQRDAGEAVSHVCAQVRAALVNCPDDALPKVVLAYEPIWAIGTGRQASPADAQAMHAAIREAVAARSPDAAQQIRILYGGSLGAATADAMFSEEDIDGGLVGGASLDATAFSTILAAAEARALRQSPLPIQLK